MMSCHVMSCQHRVTGALNAKVLLSRLAQRHLQIYNKRRLNGPRIIVARPTTNLQVLLETSCTSRHVRSAKGPHWVLQVTGTLRGQLGAITFSLTCFKKSVGAAFGFAAMADDEGYDAAAAPAQHEDELDAELFGTDDDDDLQTDQQQPEARQEGDTGFQGDQVNTRGICGPTDDSPCAITVRILCGRGVQLGRSCVTLTVLKLGRSQMKPRCRGLILLASVAL